MIKHVVRYILRVYNDVIFNDITKFIKRGGWKDYFSIWKLIFKKIIIEVIFILSYGLTNRALNIYLYFEIVIV